MSATRTGLITLLDQEKHTRQLVFTYIGRTCCLIQINPHFCFKLPVIHCPLLTVMLGGPLRMSSCGNHYGTMCNFSCAIGYRMNGSSTVTCNARANKPPGFWDKPPPICQGTFEYAQSSLVYLK